MFRGAPSGQGSSHEIDLLRIMDLWHFHWSLRLRCCVPGAFWYSIMYCILYIYLLIVYKWRLLLSSASSWEATKTAQQQKSAKKIPSFTRVFMHSTLVAILYIQWFLCQGITVEGPRDSSLWESLLINQLGFLCAPDLIHNLGLSCLQVASLGTFYGWHWLCGGLAATTLATSVRGKCVKHFETGLHVGCFGNTMIA